MIGLLIKKGTKMKKPQSKNNKKPVKRTIKENINEKTKFKEEKQKSKEKEKPSTKLKFPIIIVNLKTYIEASGKNLDRIAEAAYKIKTETGYQIVLATQIADIYKLSKRYKNKISIFAQHIDPFDPGSHTGYVLAENIIQNGAIGTLLNHSEHPMNLNNLEKTIQKSKELGLITVVCAQNEIIAEAISIFEPDIIAVEPPELIGTNISVSKAKPELILKSIEKVKETSLKRGNEKNKSLPVICGAGIKTKQDVKKAIELGTKGILVSSAIAKAKDPYKVLKEFSQGIYEALK